MSKRKFRNNNGFTLVELAVVLTCLALLSCLGMAALAQVKTSAAQAVCQDNLRRIGAAVFQYAADHNGELVPCNMGAATNTWFFLLKPYLSPEGNYNDKTTIFACPDDPAPYKNNGYSAKCAFSYGYNNSAGDGKRLKEHTNQWYYQYPKKLTQVPPETALFTEVKNKNDWMEWFVSDTSAKDGMLFPHQNEDGPAANILFIEGNVLSYSKYAMENIHQWKIWKKQ